MSRIKQFEGKPVIDAKRPLTIHVTPSDISRSDPKRPEGCAVARCLRREASAIEAKVHLGRVYVRSNNSNWQRFVTPRALRTEIIAFDRGGQFAPGEYTLLAPQPAKQATGKRQGTFTTKRGKKGTKKRAYHIVTDVRNGPAS